MVDTSRDAVTDTASPASSTPHAYPRSRRAGPTSHAFPQRHPPIPSDQPCRATSLHAEPTSPAVPPRRTLTILVRSNRASALTIATVHPTPVLADEPSPTRPYRDDEPSLQHHPRTRLHCPHPPHPRTTCQAMSCSCHADTPARPAPRQRPSHAESTDLFQPSRAKPSATCLANPARAGKEVAMIFGGVEARSGVGVGDSFLGRGDARTADPLAVEADLASNFPDRLVVLVDGFKGCSGERLTRLLFSCHGRTVGASQPAEVLPALVVHVLMVPQGMRHHLAACLHGSQSRTLRASAHTAYCATG